MHAEQSPLLLPEGAFGFGAYAGRKVSGYFYRKAGD